jgi:hypothetical protein
MQFPDLSRTQLIVRLGVALLPRALAAQNTRAYAGDLVVTRLNGYPAHKNPISRCYTKMERKRVCWWFPYLELGRHWP